LNDFIKNLLGLVATVCDLEMHYSQWLCACAFFCIISKSSFHFISWAGTNHPYSFLFNEMW